MRDQNGTVHQKMKGNRGRARQVAEMEHVFQLFEQRRAVWRRCLDQSVEDNLARSVLDDRVPGAAAPWPRTLPTPIFCWPVASTVRSSAAPMRVDSWSKFAREFGEVHALIWVPN